MAKTEITEPASGILSLQGIPAGPGGTGVFILNNTALQINGAVASANANNLIVAWSGATQSFIVASSGNIIVNGAASFAGQVSFSGILPTPLTVGVGASTGIAYSVLVQPTTPLLAKVGQAWGFENTALLVAASTGDNLFGMQVVLTGSQAGQTGVGEVAGNFSVGAAAASGVGGVADMLLGTTTPPSGNWGMFSATSRPTAIANGLVLASGGAQALAIGSNTTLGIFAGTNATPGNIGAGVGSLYISTANASAARLWSCSAASTNGTNTWTNMLSLA